jgi:hypothetical protein
MTTAILACEPDVVLLLVGTNDVTWTMIRPNELDVPGIWSRLDALLTDL